MEDGIPYWREKSLEEMSEAEWERLCDGCGRCCLNKLEDWDTGEVHWTDVACGLLDRHACRCTNYGCRHALVPDCIRLTPETVRRLSWLPSTCAYRLVAEGRDLYWWHPLVSGDPETVHLAGVSVRGRTVPEADVPVEDWEDHLVSWPGEDIAAGALPCGNEDAPTADRSPGSPAGRPSDRPCQPAANVPVTGRRHTGGTPLHAIDTTGVGPARRAAGTGRRSPQAPGSQRRSRDER